MNQKTSKNENVDLEDLVRIFWKFKIIFLISILLFILYGIYSIKTSEVKYLISMDVLPTNEKMGGNNNNSALNEIFGLNLKSSTSETFDLYKSLINSRALAVELRKDKNLVKIFFPNNNIRKELSIIQKLKNFIKGLFGLNLSKNEITLTDKFHNMVSGIKVDTQGSSKITKLSIESADIEKSMFLLEKAHNTSDKILKERKLIRSKNNIEFLVNSLSKTNVLDQRTALISTLATEQKTLMTASSDLSFAADILVLPHSSTNPVKPRPKFILIICLISGVLFGSLITLILNWYYIKKSVS